MKAERLRTPTVDEIFHEACALATEARAAYLTRVCAGDETLRQEIEELLACDEAHTEFLAHSPLNTASWQAGAPTLLDSAASTRGSSAWHIGPYQVLGKLGEGGMGAVYHAYDAQRAQDVAIKMVRKDLAHHEEMLARFDREGRMLNLLKELKHPHIAELYEQGETDGAPYLVLEYVPGATLAELLTRQRLTIAETLDISRQIATALAAAHSQRIHHRDLKPANIKITPAGQVKVLDFGLAKRFRRDWGPDDVTETETRSLTLTASARKGLGTPAYKSPEQWKEEDTDHRTDLWAFGCLLFEMLSGQRPFARKTGAEMIKAALHEDPDWKLLPKETPPALQYLLHRCLQKDPALRPNSAAEVVSELEQIARGQWLSRLRSRLWQTQAYLRTQARNAAALAMTAALIVATYGWLNKPAPLTAMIPEQKYLAITIRQPQTTQATPDGSQEQLAYGLAASLKAALENGRGMNVLLAPPNLEVGKIIAQTGANLLLNLDVQAGDGQTSVNYSLTDARGTAFAPAQSSGNETLPLKLSNQVAEKVAQTLGVQFDAQSQAVSQTDLPDRNAQETYLQALGYLQDLGLSKPAETERAVYLLDLMQNKERNSALVQALLVQAYIVNYKRTQQPQWLEKAEQRARRAQQLNPTLPEVQFARGYLDRYQGRYAQASAIFDKLIERQPDSLLPLLGKADAQQAAGQFAAAEPVFQTAIAKRPDYYVGYNELGNLFFRQGQYEKAAEQWRRVVALNPDNPYGHSNLGNAYYYLWKPEEALEAYRQSIIRKPTAEAHSNRGAIYFALGRYEEAAAEFDKGLTFNAENPDLLGNLADACRWTDKRKAEAPALYDKAIKLREGQLRQNPNDLDQLTRLAEWQAKRGKTKEALKNITRALQRNPQNLSVISVAVTVYHLAGDDKRALQWLGSYREAGEDLSELLKNPELPILRAHPDFERIVNRRQ